MHLSLGKMYQSPDQCQEQQQYTRRTHKSLFFANGTEDKVGILLRHIFQFGLGAIQESLTLQSTRTNGNLTLMHVITSSLQVFLQSEQHVDTHPLVGLKHVVQSVVGHIVEQQRTQCKCRNPQIVAEACGQETV